MSGEVSAEDREKAITALDSAFRGNPPHGSKTWPAAAYDVMMSAGWRPCGAPARPTREALSGALIQYLDAGWRVGAHMDALVAKCDGIAGALLAADHLWAEQPNPTVVALQALRAWLLTERFLDEPEGQLTPLNEREADHLIDHLSGLFMDRATAEAEQREKDAQTAEQTDGGSIALNMAAAAIRAGGAS